MPKKILVTGATGFIGHYVIENLLQKEIEVIASSHHQEKARLMPWYQKVKYIPFDIHSDFSSLNLFECFDKPEACIHLSWQGLPHYKELYHIEKELPVQFQFLSNLLEHGLKNLSVTGTCFEYGMQEGELTEDMAVKPNNNYAKAKNELRLMLESMQQNYSFSFKWLRLFYMYGKGQNPKSLFSQLEHALCRNDEEFNMSGGEQVRDFLPVEKVAAYIVKAALQTEVNGVINVSSNKPITVKQFIENYLLEKQKNIQLNLGVYPYPDFEPREFWGNNHKLLSIPG